MVMDANFGVSEAGKVFLSQVGESAIEAVWLLMVELLTSKRTGLTTIGW